jgi:hypothetical protein
MLIAKACSSYKWQQQLLSVAVEENLSFYGIFIPKCCKNAIEASLHFTLY